MNEIRYCSIGDLEGIQGFRTMLVGPEFPDVSEIVAIPLAGPGYGYLKTKITENCEFLDAIVHDWAPEPGFYDGRKVRQTTHAVVQSAGAKQWVKVPYWRKETEPAKLDVQVL